MINFRVVTEIYEGSSSEKKVLSDGRVGNRGRFKPRGTERVPVVDEEVRKGEGDEGQTSSEYMR